MDDITEDSLFEAPPIFEQERMVEAILFASAEPVSLKEMTKRMPHGVDLPLALKNLQKYYSGRGVEVVRVGETWAIRTAADLGFLMLHPSRISQYGARIARAGPRQGRRRASWSTR